MNPLRHPRIFTLTASVLVALVVRTSAQDFADYSPLMGGATTHHTWTNLTLPPGVSPGVSGTAGQWAGTTTPTNQGIVSNGGSLADRFYVPLTPAGTALNPSETTDFVGGGIYSFFSSTHLAISSTAPLAEMGSFVLQLSIAAGTSSGFGGAAVDLLSGPTLNLTLADNSTVALGATYSLLESSSPYTVPGIGISTTLDTLGYQWDLSSILQPIASYSIDFQLGFHAIAFGADTTASTSDLNASILTPIPEPGTAVFGIALIGGLLVRRGRTRSTVAA